MSVQQGRPSQFWVAIVAVALLLLGIILIVVILLSTRLRQAERRTVVQFVPVGSTPTAAPLHAAQPPTRPSRAADHPQRPEPKLERNSGKPDQIAQRPVKVIEKQVKVVEKQVTVIERPVKVVRVPAKAAQHPARATVPSVEPVERTAAVRESTDRVSGTGTFQETGLPNQITYAGKLWNASEVVKDRSADELAADSHLVDGRTIYHDKDADAPYPSVCIKVAGETEQYVRYVPTTS